MMNPKQEQGTLGETYIINYYRSQGYQVHPSTLPFSFFDLFVYNNTTAFTVQVKTLTRYVYENRFSIKDGPKEQTISNTQACDKLIIVTKKPNHHKVKEDPQFQGNVYEVINHKNLIPKNKELIIPSTPKHIQYLYTLNEQEQEQINRINICL